MRILTPLLLVSCFLLSGCTQLFFQPDSRHGLYPSDVGYDYEDVYIQSSDGVRLHGWLIEPVLAEGEDPKGLVYFLHGNAQNISWHFNGARWLVNAGYRVFALDYRGYGQSTGVATLPGAYDDITVGYEWLKANEELRQLENKQSTIILFGQSLGASLSLNWLAAYPKAQDDVSHVVLDSAFSSFGAVAKEVANNLWLTWLFQYPAQWFLSDEIDPVESIQALSLPILLLHSEEDQVVRYRHSEVLLNAGGSNVQRISGKGPHIAVLRDSVVRNGALVWLSNSQLD